MTANKFSSRKNIFNQELRLRGEAMYLNMRYHCLSLTSSNKLDVYSECPVARTARNLALSLYAHTNSVGVDMVRMMYSNRENTFPVGLFQNQLCLPPGLLQKLCNK